MKKKAATHKKRNRKRERKKEPCQEAAKRIPQYELRKINGTLVLVPRFTGPRATLYSGKLAQNPDSPIAVAKYLAEELRASVPYGVRSLMKEVQWRWPLKGFVPKMLKALGEYLEDEQPVFDKMDYQIVDIVNQHPTYTIKQTTEALDKQNPGRKWGTLTRRVQRLLKNVPR